MDTKYSKLSHRASVSAIFVLLICCAELKPHCECFQPLAKASAAATLVNGTTFKTIFVFGDSYADIGNHDPKNNTRTVVGPVNQPWLVPYGQSDGAPSGRYSSGIILSDYLAGYMGLHPRPYLVYQNRPETRTEDGINFAVGDAGVFDNLGFTKTSDQIAQLKALLNGGVTYPGTVYNDSLILYTISGNDYSAFFRNTPIYDLLKIYAFIGTVVDQIIKDLKSLYDLGFRDFTVSNLPPVGCLPGSTHFPYISCNEILNTVSTQHNMMLESQISTNISTLPGANVILLNIQLAFTEIFTDPQVRTEFPIPLKACCVGVGTTNGISNLCGDVDETGQPQFTVCSVNATASYFFWDYAHPTEAGWAYVFNLFLQGNDSKYTNGKSLSQFLQR